MVLKMLSLVARQPPIILLGCGWVKWVIDLLNVNRNQTPSLVPKPRPQSAHTNSCCVFKRDVARCMFTHKCTHRQTNIQLSTQTPYINAYIHSSNPNNAAGMYHLQIIFTPVNSETVAGIHTRPQGMLVEWELWIPPLFSRDSVLPPLIHTCTYTHTLRTTTLGNSLQQ